MKKLTKKQIRIIDMLFENGGDENALFSCEIVSKKMWSRLMADEAFQRAIDRRIEMAKRQSGILLAKFISVAAAKLVELCNSDKPDVARKACIDILSLPQAAETRKAVDLPENTKIPAKTAAKMLKILSKAGDKK